MRLFVAVDFDSIKLRDIAINIQKIIQNLRIRATYPRVEDLHITLKFLGEVDESLLNEILNRLSVIKMKKTKIVVSGIGGFPSVFKPRVIFLNVENYNGLKKLYESVESRLYPLFPRESRPFKPHITVARIKQFIRFDENTVKKLNSLIEPIEIEVSNYKLKQSILSSSGPIYRDLAIFELE